MGPLVRGYGAYLAVLYAMVVLLAINVAMCVWVAWCFKERKFPVVWPIQLGISCRYNGPDKPHMHFDMFPEYSCAKAPHLFHAVVSAISLVVFVVIALLLNMSEVLLTLVDVFIGYKTVAACVYMGLSLALAYQYIRWNPNLVGWMNYLKSGVSTMIVWCSGMLMLLVFHPGVKAAGVADWQFVITIVMLSGMGPAFLVGGFMSWFMIRHKTKTSLHDLAANFMIDVLGVSQSGNNRVEDAGKLNPGLMCRFIMFVRQQQATQKAAGKTANEGISMDLLGYVEYQRKQRMVIRLHREALQAMCNFWKLLDVHRVSFMHLSKALGKIESSAQAAYRVVLQSYGNNPKLVRLYGRFLQTVKNDPWAANEYFQEADRLEETKDGDSNGPLLPDGTPLGRMDDMATAVLVINATGEIQMANKQTYLTFGYKRGTLEGKPMSTLLAPHYTKWLSSQLAGLVAASGLAAVTLGAQEERTSAGREALVVGMHYDRMAFRVKLSLNKASGVGEDSTFIALLEPVNPARGVSTIWVAQNGTIAACDPSFLSTFGWKASEVNGANITAFVSVPALTLATAEGLEDIEEADRMSGRNFGESPSDVVSRILVEARATIKAEKFGRGGIQCYVAHKYDSAPSGCLLSVMQSDAADSALVHEMHVRLLSGDPEQLLVANRKGLLVHVSCELAVFLTDAHAVAPGKARRYSMDQQAAAAASGGLGHAPVITQFGVAAPGHTRPRIGTVAPAQDLLSGYTLSDFLPSPWKEMHLKFLKASKGFGTGWRWQSSTSRGQFSCRKGGPSGPTLEMRTANGKPLYMRVSVSTSDVSGELTHVVRMARSSLDTALAERRVRLSISPDGQISSVRGGAPSQLFGIETSQILGRGLWEIIDGFENGLDGESSLSGPRMLSAVTKRTVATPGISWRVRVVPPRGRARTPKDKALMADLDAVTRTSASRLAVLQMHIEAAQANAAADRGPSLFVDLWPATTVSGVLELDAGGRITAVLEERTRPAGLLFGVSCQALVGSTLRDVVALPPGRTLPGDLLTLHSAKKSSLKSGKKEASVKVGPVHVLQGMHVDGRPLALEVQVVGKPGPLQPATAILRMHVAPMVPSLFSSAPGDAMNRYSTNMRTAALNQPSDKLLRAGSFRAWPTEVDGPSQPPPATPPAPPGVEEADIAVAARGAAGNGKEGPVDPWEALEKEIMNSPSSAHVPTPSVLGSRRPTITPDADNAMASAAVIASAADVVPCLASQPAIEEPPCLGTPPFGGSDGLPVPNAAAGKAAALAARSKLAGLVKGTDGDPANPSLSRGSERLRPRAGSSRFASMQFEQDRPSSRLLSGLGHVLPGVASVDENAHDDEILQGAAELLTLPEDAADQLRGDMGLQSLPDSNADSEADKPAQKENKGSERISTWVASRGALYQNSVPHGDHGAPIQGSAGQGPNTDDPAGKSNPGLRAEPGGYEDDDARSEGGASAASGQSAGTIGAENGRRFRKLAKLMNSSQAQQVQNRLRTHALVTVAILAVIHIVCFALVIIAIKKQRDAMLQLGRNVEAVRYMQIIMTDVRSLDIISRNKSIPTLYTAADAPDMINRIADNAYQVKIRLNDILEGNNKDGSPVLNLMFYQPFREALTRFYAMAVNIVQYHSEWVQQGINVASTTPGQYLLKAGPDLYSEFRKTTDALLYQTVDSVHAVDNLQLVFLGIEGCAVSFVAACYLAYLLRAVAAQRMSLYRCFLLIPVGLTRVLASQNTALVLDEDDEDEIDDDAEKAEAMTLDAGEDAVTTGPTRRRRATLNITESGGMYGGGTENGYGSARPGGGAGRPSANGIVSPTRGDLSAERRMSDRALRHRNSESMAVTSGCLGSFKLFLRRMLRWRSSGGVSPLMSGAGGAGASFNASGKRTLKDDSYETAMMLLPFIVWSALVIAFYVTAVVQMKGMVEVVAIHSVVNRISARTFQSVFFSQELANVEDPSQLAARRAGLARVMKLARDAWLTLQLGRHAYKAGGNETEVFPLVKEGLAHATPELADLFYGAGKCHRQQAHLPCPGPEYRYYQITHTGLDSMMAQFFMAITSMASKKSLVPDGLAEEHFDYIYNVGTRDLVDGTIKMRLLHYDLIVQLFQGILLLHIILFLLLWIIFLGFIVLLLNPLLKRAVKERRRIAELMSQLPLELDVERLIARALGTATNANGGGPGGGPPTVHIRSRRRVASTSAQRDESGMITLRHGHAAT
ncbi:hypothetical protein GPECTOR_52g60 [Gonium pectorale]|uniref:PAS domain-containing protein n=1 Tax=Gonium pectorale TaxID=33097 RepID=A0A150G738_GONPE|nr:hypothetical protein GPECTOR_52g60 [Gonium pectorale]|eukprot:KXZ45662.1 hypothetical protein GPECTOR_52g60 [Gonium pectorale]